MRQRPLFTVLCVAGTIASGVFLSGQVGARAAAAGAGHARQGRRRQARRGRAAPPCRSRCRPASSSSVLGARRPDRRSGGARGHARRHRLRRRHAAQQPAARHPRPPGLDDDRAHDEDGGGPAPLLHRRDGAGQQRARTAGSPTPTATASRTSATSPSSRSASTASRDTDGDGIADKSQIVYEGFNDDPTWDTIGGVLLDDNKDLVVVVPPGVYRLHDAKGDGKFSQRSTIAEGMNIHPAFGGHGVSGVLDGPGRTPLLGSRRHRPQRHRSQRQDVGLPEPRRGDALRSGRLELRGVRLRHPQPAGVLVRRARQPDQRRQRRRLSERGRARRLPAVGIGDRLALDVAVRQVHRPEEQQVQRLDRRGHVQAALRRPHRAHAGADRQLARRPVGHGLQPGHGPVGRLEEPLLRHQLRRLGVDGARLRLQARGEGRRLRDGAGADAAQGHPRRRPAHRPGRARSTSPTGSRAGIRRTRAASGSSTRPRRPTARSARTS